MSLEKSLLASQGYLELGMPDESLAELDRLPEDVKHTEPVLSIRLTIFMAAKRWEDALPVCEALRRVAPSNSIGFIHGAFCLHELGRTAEALQLLLTMPSSLKKEAVYHYNLGCYYAVLGQPDEACRHLQKSFELDSKFREIAKRDPDLVSVKDLL